MTDPPKNHVSRALAEAGWTAALDRVRSRAVHDLNGRVSALLAVAELSLSPAGDAEPGPQLADYLHAEVEKIEHLAARLGALRADPTGPAEPAAADELTGAATVAAAWQRGLEGVDVVGDAPEHLPPVLVGRERFLAVMLVLVGRAGLAVAQAGGGQVRLTATERDEGVAWTLAPDPAPTGAALAALDRVLAMDGGRATADGATEVWLPSLARARAEGR